KARQSTPADDKGIREQKRILTQGEGSRGGYKPSIVEAKDVDAGWLEGCIVGLVKKGIPIGFIQNEMAEPRLVTRSGGEVLAMGKVTAMIADEKSGFVM
ncbi:hypothetical protein U1Q18_037064, partial [Sarracenia purpurea var. burkii]